MSTKVYKTTLTAGYCNHWAVDKAIMEFVTNAMDSHGTFTYEFNEDSILLSNEGVKVAATMLLMGVSNKRGDGKSLGMFGCGSGQSICVILASGASISIVNSDVKWDFSFELHEDFGYETLHITETPIENSLGNFDVHITNLNEDIIAGVKSRCLYFQEEPEILFSSGNCEVLSKEQAGNVYIASIFVQNNPRFKYGYNFDVNTLKLGQDREAVGDFDLVWETSKVWGQYAPEELLCDVIKEKPYDIEYAHHYTSRVSDTLANAWIEENPNTIITNDYDEVKSLQENDIKVEYVQNSLLTSAIKASSIYQEAEEVIKEGIVEEDEDTPFELLEDLLYKFSEEYPDHPFDKDVVEILEQAESWYC